MCGDPGAPRHAIAASLAPGSPWPQTRFPLGSLSPHNTLPTTRVLLRWGQMPPPPLPLPGDCGMYPSHFIGWLPAAPAVIFLCFPFISPSQTHSLAPAACRDGETPFAQALLATSGTHFLLVPSSLRCWRHILLFIFSPRAAGLWLGQV